MSKFSAGGRNMGETLNLDKQNNMWIAMITGFFFSMHAALMARSNVAKSNMCMIYE